MRSPTRDLTLLLSAFALLLPAALVARQHGPPRLSPSATVSQVIGVSEVSITYGRPSLRERELWGALVPWDLVWRTGANEATTITISDDARVEGRALPAGTYSLFTIPGEGEWTIIFNHVAEQWGAFQYDSNRDALRVAVQPRSAPHQETFEIRFTHVGTDTAIINLHWGTVAVPFTMQFDARRIARQRAREFVASAGPEDGRDVWTWANYFYQNDDNLDEALSWAAELAAASPVYWTHALHARLLAKTGDTAAAVSAATAALARSQAEGDQPGVSADAEVLREELAQWRAVIDP